MIQKATNLREKILKEVIKQPTEVRAIFSNMHVISDILTSVQALVISLCQRKSN